MQAATALAAMQEFPVATLRERFGTGGLVIVAPHPDDESLGCGGLIATAAAEGRALRILIVSDGTGSHPGSRAFPAPRLAELRQAEARQAIGELGADPADLRFLGQRDRFVAVENASIAAIVAAASETRAAGIFVTWRHDPHGDHQAAARLALAAQNRLPGVALYEYSVWGATLPAEAPVEPVSSGFRLWIEPYRAAKRRAILAHRSQVTGLIDDDPAGFRLSAADLARFDLPFESFARSPLSVRNGG